MGTMIEARDEAGARWADPAGEERLPAGTLTFLMTDIEGSTALWDRYPDEMRRAIGRHDALFDELLVRHGGRQIKERGEGDSIFAVFTSVAAALAAVCALQQALHEEPWPEHTPIRARMGLHTGEADLRDGGYYGVTVNRAARIRSLGHGGQILISQSTNDLLRDALPTGIAVRALGAFLLKGLQRPEPIYQLLHPALPADFPPLQGEHMPRSNLPADLTSFVGRQREQTAVQRLLQEARLLTLTGVGGCGKTRLALRVAQAAREGIAPDADGAGMDQAGAAHPYPDGVWLLELAPLTDVPSAALLTRALVDLFNLRREPDRPLLATLTEYLRARRLLLLLDNCEHLVAPCAEVASALLRACPALRILATSREALGVPGERTYLVPSLALPEAGHTDPALLCGVEAVSLFLERAQTQHPAFALHERNAQAVCRICAQLDGIPLAIELAAARVGSLPVESIAARLENIFRLLTTGPRAAVPRQQTLRAALDWSHELLSAGEQLLLHRVSVFAGSWSLEAAEQVCAGAGVERIAVLDLLEGLVRKSLVLLVDENETPRYRMLEPVRQYAGMHLEDPARVEEAGTARDLHLHYFWRMAEEAATAHRESTRTGMRPQEWLARLEREHDNLRQALAWSLRGPGNGEMPARLTTALAWFWEIRDHLGEGLHWLEAALARAVDPTPIRAAALDRAGCLAWCLNRYEQATALYQESLDLWWALGGKQGMAAALDGLGSVAAARDDYARADQALTEALGIWEEIGDVRGRADCLNSLGNLASDRGEYERAATLYGESLRLWQEAREPWGIAGALNHLGNLARDRGAYDEAMAYLEESLAIRRELGNRRGMAETISIMADVEHLGGHMDRAHAHHQESLAMRRALDDRLGIAASQLSMGLLALESGDADTATTLLKESLRAFQALGDRWGMAGSLEALAGAAMARSLAERAARLFGAGAALRLAINAPLPPSYRALYDRCVAGARAALGEDGMTAAWSAGAALPFAEAVAEALNG